MKKHGNHSSGNSGHGNGNHAQSGQGLGGLFGKVLENSTKKHSSHHTEHQHQSSAATSSPRPGPIAAFGNLIHEGQQRKAEQQRQHDEDIARSAAKAQELKDRERRLRERETQETWREVGNAADRFVDDLGANERAAQRRRDADAQRSQADALARQNELARQALRAQEQALAHKLAEEELREKLRIESLSKPHIDAARTYRNAERYSQAMTEYGYALDVIATGKEVGYIGSLLNAVRTTHYDLTNPQIAQLYAERAECHLDNKEYLLAYNQLKELDTHPTKIANIQDRINNCKSVISSQISRLLIEAETALSNQSALSAVKTPLATARELATGINNCNLLPQINNLDKRIAWEEKKPTFTAEYKRIVQIDINDESINFQSLAQDLNTLINLYDQNIIQPSPEEQSNRVHLKNIIAEVKAKLAVQLEQQRWQAARSTVNATFEHIAAQKQSYPSTQLDQIIKDLNNCSDSYIKNAKFTNNQEKVNLNAIPDLLVNANRQLIERNAHDERQADKTRALAAEQSIITLLNEAHDELCLSSLQAAYNKLLTVRKKAADIKNMEDIAEQTRGWIYNLEKSIRDLNQELELYKARLKTLPLDYTRHILHTTMAKVQHKKCAKILLERHEDRLTKSISADIERHWAKFNNKSEDELNRFFDKIIGMLLIEIQPITWSTWLGNWTSAGLYIPNPRSQQIAPEISAKIEQHTPETQPFYVRLAIFADRNHQAVYPVAQIAEYAEVVPAPYHQNSFGADGQPLPSAPPMTPRKLEFCS
jgi:hypothetical protein